MDLRSIEYFITIVENDFNITQAAEKLYISQPALSKGVNSLEKDNGIILFERSKGRLQNLTPAGITLYVKGVSLLKNYKTLVESVTKEANEIKGDLNLGIAPVIISCLFPTALPKYIRDNPSINLHLVEEGALSLKDKLKNDEIHLATLLSPTGLDSNSYEQTKLSQNQLTVFLDSKHPLASKKKLCWQDFNEQPIAIFSDSYMINQQLTDYFVKNNVLPRIQLKSDSWDLLLNSTRGSNLITILPKPLSLFYNMDGISMVDFEDDIKWDIYLCRKKKKVYSNVEEHTYNYFIEFFENNSLI